MAGYHDHGGIQQALDLGADGGLVPYINTAEEARQAVSCALYPAAGTRSVYFPQRATNKAGLLGYAGNANKNIIVALQVETASCIEKHRRDRRGSRRGHALPRPKRPVRGAATSALIAAAKKNNVILGLFLFGTARVVEFLDKEFTFISIGNDLHHVLTQAGAYVKDMESIAKDKGKEWTRRPTALV